MIEKKKNDDQREVGEDMKEGLQRLEAGGEEHEVSLSRNQR